MIKNTVIALATAATLAGIAVPAIAAPAAAPEDDSSFDSDYVLAELAAKGIDAWRVEEWGSSYIVAFTTNAEGAQTMIYLDPATLNVVTP